MRPEVQEADERTDSYPLRFEGPDPTEYPRLVPDTEPIGGRIREIPEDFEVQEIPLYPFSGSGEHCYITLVKRNRTTLEVRDFLARCFNVPDDDVGFAGFKDRRAVAQQTFSIPGVRDPDVQALERPWLRVLDVTYHTNKLRTGHLKGNRFRIRVRGIRENSGPTIDEILARLKVTGVPNFFGPQRFGYFGDSYRIGKALLRRDPREAITALLAPRSDHDEPYRLFYGEGKYQDALDALPPGRRCEAAILHSLRRYPGNYRAAARRIPRQIRRMFFSAYQAFLFNWCLRERMAWSDDAFARPELGDLAFLHRNGASFLVEDLEEAIRRAATGEISPSGPIFGRRMTFAQGREGALEQAILAHEKMRPQSFLSHVKGLKLNGSRRAYRVWFTELDWYQEPEGSILLSFTLPSGCYATIVLEQLMGREAVQPRIGWENSGAEDESEDGLDD